MGGKTTPHAQGGALYKSDSSKAQRRLHDSPHAASVTKHKDPPQMAHEALPPWAKPSFLDTSLAISQWANRPFASAPAVTST